MATKFRIAAVQLNMGLRASEILKSIEKYINIAKLGGAEIICFPECSLNRGPKQNKIILEKITEICKKNKIWCIVVGNLVERKKVYNSAILINSEGKISGKHKKVHICDAPHVSAGSSFEVFDTPFCKIGMAICWDINYPDPLHIMAKKGAKLIFCPMYWHYELWSHSKNHLHYEKKILESLILTRSYENLAYVVFCNPFNESQSTLTSYSAIAEPHKIIKQISNREGMIEAEVDLKYLEKIRKRYNKEYNKFISR